MELVSSSQASCMELDESADREIEELKNSMQEEEEERIVKVQAAETQVCYDFIALVLNHSGGYRLWLPTS